MPVNLNFYQKGNKSDAARKLIIDTKLNTEKPDASKEKVRDKISQMIKTYKETRALADATGWGVEPTKHEMVANNTHGETIKEVIIKKCFYYYDFEDVMGDSPTISPPFLVESIRSNPTSKEGSPEVEKLSDNRGEINSSDYENWPSKTGINREENDSDSSFEDIAPLSRNSRFTFTIPSGDNLPSGPTASDLPKGGKTLNKHRIKAKRPINKRNIDSDSEEGGGTDKTSKKSKPRCSIGRNSGYEIKRYGGAIAGGSS